MNRAFIFPGQGSQKVGMCSNLIQNFAVAKEVFEEVDDSLSFKLSKIIFEGPEEELTKTENAQPAILAASISLLRVIEQIAGKKAEELCSLVAGHSLGQYSALCGAGSISLRDAAKILRLRGKYMQEACPEGVGAMAAIMGASEDLIISILERSAKIGVCEIANDNSAEQKVISGQSNAIDFAIEKFKESGAKAIKLKVSAPFHCSLIQGAAEKMREELESIQLLDSKIDIIDNVSLEVTKNAPFLKRKLVEQITGTVRWRETMDLISSKQLDVFEVGEGKVLTNLFARSYPNIVCKPLNTPEDIEAIDFSAS